MVARCSKCQTVNPQNSQFCVECGTRISAATYNPVVAASVQGGPEVVQSKSFAPAPVPARKERLTGGWRGLAGVGVVAVAGIGEQFFYSPAIISLVLLGLLYGGLVLWAFFPGINPTRRWLIVGAALSCAAIGLVVYQYISYRGINFSGGWDVPDVDSLPMGLLFGLATVFLVQPPKMRWWWLLFHILTLPAILWAVTLFAYTSYNSFVANLLFFALLGLVVSGFRRLVPELRLS